MRQQTKIFCLFRKKLLEETENVTMPFLVSFQFLYIPLPVSSINSFHSLHRLCQFLISANSFPVSCKVYFLVASVGSIITLKVFFISFFPCSLAIHSQFLTKILSKLLLIKFPVSSISFPVYPTNSFSVLSYSIPSFFSVPRSLMAVFFNIIQKFSLRFSKNHSYFYPKILNLPTSNQDTPQDHPFCFQDRSLSHLVSQIFTDFNSYCFKFFSDFFIQIPMSRSSIQCPGIYLGWLNQFFFKNNLKVFLWWGICLPWPPLSSAIVGFVPKSCF